MVNKHLAVSVAYRIRFDVISRSVLCLCLFLFPEPGLYIECNFTRDASALASCSFRPLGIGLSLCLFLCAQPWLYIECNFTHDASRLILITFGFMARARFDRSSSPAIYTRKEGQHL